MERGDDDDDDGDDDDDDDGNGVWDGTRMGAERKRAAYRNVVGVHWVEVVGAAIRLGHEVRDELVPVEVVVDPGLRAAALLQAQHAAVKLAGKAEVMHRDGVMERRDGRAKRDGPLVG